MALIEKETVAVEAEGLSVDLIVWRKFRRPMPGYVEAVFDTNMGLAALSDYLPVGTVFELPAVELDPLPAIPDLVLLWD